MDITFYRKLNICPQVRLLTFTKSGNYNPRRNGQALRSLLQHVCCKKCQTAKVLRNRNVTNDFGPDDVSSKSNLKTHLATALLVRNTAPVLCLSSTLEVASGRRDSAVLSSVPQNYVLLPPDAANDSLAASLEDVANASDHNAVFGPRYAGTVRIVIITLMISVSLVGNTVVCWRLLTSRRHRYFKAQILFLNLAFADLLVTVVTMGSQLVWEVMGRLWVAGDAFCRAFKVLQTFALVSSTYMLVSIAVERHYAIVNPLSPCPRPRALAGLAWAFSLLPSLPNVYIFRLVTVASGKCYCASIFYIDKSHALSRQMYMAFVCVTVFIIPLLLLVVLYGNILLEIWRLGKCGPVQQSSTLPRARVKTLKMTVIIFLAFVVTNVPYMVQEMVLAFAENASLDQNVVAIFGVISASNSAVNPYVYLSFNMRSGCLGSALDKLTGQSKYSCQKTPVLLRFKANPPSCKGGDTGPSSTGVSNPYHSKNHGNSLVISGSSTSHKALYYNVV